MRLENTDHQGRYKVWMNYQDYQKLITYAPTTKHEIVIRLGGECGLRSHEITQIKPSSYYESSTEKGEYLLKVPQGKDTTGKGGKFRTTYLPKDLWSTLEKYKNSEGIREGDPFFDYSPRHIRRLVKEVATKTKEETRIEDYSYLSSHDLRRFFAHYNLVEKGKNPKVIQKLGGWETYKAMKPYLDEPSEKNIIETMKK